MNIRILDPAQQDAWNAAADELPAATFYHRYEWREVIARQFGFPPLYLYAEDSTGICGLLPLYLVRRPLQGTALISSPLCVYGGVAAHSTEVAEQLETAAIWHAQKIHASYLELRDLRRGTGPWVVRDQYCTFRRALAATAEDGLKAVPRKQRAEIRKAQAAGLSAVANRDLEQFYALYSVSMRNLGSPVFSRRYYASLLEAFGDRCGILTVYQGEQALSSVLSFYYKNEVLPFYGGGVEQARAANAFPFMYWELMRRAIETGYERYDFGRSMRGTGAFSFKENFGFEPEPLYYRYYLNGARSAPNIHPDRPLFKLLSGIWRRLPAPIANRLGPLVAKAIV